MPFPPRLVSASSSMLERSFSWTGVTGRTVKHLAGTGAVYVQLTIEHEEDGESYSSVSDSLPDVKIIK